MNLNQKDMGKQAPGTRSSGLLQKKRSTSCLLGQLIVSVLGMSLGNPVAIAQTTTCTGTSTGSCLDLYQGTLAAMQAVGFVPSGLSDDSGATSSGAPIIAPWSIASFSGGVINGSPMVFSVPPGTGEPGNQNIAATYVSNCPGNTSNATGTITLSATISDTTEISSNQSVTNSSETFNNGSSTVTIGYASPNVSGGPSVSGSTTYNWGQQTTESTTTGGGTSNTTGNASTYTAEYNYSVPVGYIQAISLNNSVTNYSNVTWTSQINVTDPDTDPLSNTLFSQQFKNTISPTATTTNLNGSGKAANVWYPPNTWSGTNLDVLASPSGTYAFFPDNNSYLYGLYWAAANSAEVMFKQGSDSSSNGFTLYFGTNSPDNNKYGNFWGGTGSGSPDTQSVQWHPTVSPAYIALVDDGDLIAYDSANNNIWSSNTAKGVVTPPTLAYPATLQQLLPSGTPFTATGDYNATIYATNSYIGATAATPMTSEQLAQYCPGSSTSEAPAAEMMPYGGAQYVPAAYNPAHETGAFVKAQLRDDDQERQRLELLRRNESGERRLAPEDRGLQQRNSRDGEAQSLERHRGLGKVVKIRGPLVLRPDQFYVADLPGLKVTKVTVRSDSLTNYVGFAPAPDVKKEDLTKSRPVRLHIGKTRKFSVKPKPMI